LEIPFKLNNPFSKSQFAKLKKISAIAFSKSIFSYRDIKKSGELPDFLKKQNSIFQIGATCV